MIQIAIPEEELERIYGNLRQALTQIQADFPDVKWKLVYDNPEFFNTVAECIHGHYAVVIFELPCESIAAHWRLNGIKLNKVRSPV